MHNDVNNVFESIIPRSEYTSWYVTKIKNPNLPEDEIHFKYKAYGKFNYYKEYLQKKLKLAMELEAKKKGLSELTDS